MPILRNGASLMLCLPTPIVNTTPTERVSDFWFGNYH